MYMKISDAGAATSGRVRLFDSAPTREPALPRIGIGPPDLRKEDATIFRRATQNPKPMQGRARAFVHRQGARLTVFSFGDEDRIGGPIDVYPFEAQRLADAGPLPAEHRSNRLDVRGVARDQAVSLIGRKEPQPLIIHAVAAWQLGRVEPFISRKVIDCRLKGGTEPLHGRGRKPATARAFEFRPCVRRLRNAAIADYSVDLIDLPKVIRPHTASAGGVAQTCVGNRQGVRPPAKTVKDFVADVRLKLRSVGVCNVAAICAARMFFDDARFPPDTDRTADVEIFSTLPDGEHVVIASIKAAYIRSVTK
jgi:hypothetical protein